MKMIKISLKKLNAITVGKLAGVATLMSGAIYGNLLVFFGLKPFTAAEIKALVDTYISARNDFKLGGILQKPAYWAAKTALRNCILAFAPYVDGIAMGDKAILALSTLPTDEDEIDAAAAILAGGVAEGVVAKQGTTGKMLVDCIPFGTGVNYLLVISEGMPRSAGITVEPTGAVKIPADTLNNIMVCGTTSRKKIIGGLTPGVLYFLSYVIMFGNIVSGFSDEATGSCGN